MTIKELSKLIDLVGRELLRRKRSRPGDKVLADAYYMSWVVMQPAMEALRSMRTMIKSKELPVIDYETWMHYTEHEFSYAEVQHYVIGFMRAKRRPYKEIKFAISFLENYLPDDYLPEEDLPF